MKLLARYVPRLERHLSSGNRINYLSNTIMEEEVATLAKISRQKIFQDISNANFWTVICDGSTDVYKTDHTALLIRYVEVDYPERREASKESFIAFFNLSDHSARGYMTGLLDCFNKYHLNVTHLVGQAYDGASVMSGAVFRRFFVRRFQHLNVMRLSRTCIVHYISVILFYTAQLKKPRRLLCWISL